MTEEENSWVGIMGGLPYAVLYFLFAIAASFIFGNVGGFLFAAGFAAGTFWGMIRAAEHFQKKALEG